MLATSSLNTSEQFYKYQHWRTPWISFSHCRYAKEEDPDGLADALFEEKVRGGLWRKHPDFPDKEARSKRTHPWWVTFQSRIRICTNSPKTKGCWSSAPTRVACLSGAKTGQSLQRGGWTFAVGGWAWSEDQPHCYHSREGLWWWWWHVTWHHDSVTHAHAVQFEWLPNTISYFLKAIPNFIQTLPKWMCDTYMKGIHPWLQLLSKSSKIVAPACPCKSHCYEAWRGLADWVHTIDETASQSKVQEKECQRN